MAPPSFEAKLLRNSFLCLMLTMHPPSDTISLLEHAKSIAPPKPLLDNFELSVEVGLRTIALFP